MKNYELSRALKLLASDFMFKWGEGYVKAELNTNKHGSGKRFILWVTKDGGGKIMLGESDTIRGCKRIVNNTFKEFNLFNHWECSDHDGVELVGYEWGFLTPEKKLEWGKQEPSFVV